MSKLWNEILVKDKDSENYEFMTVGELTVCDDALKKKLDGMAQTKTYSIPTTEWLRERSKLRTIREEVCRIRWAKLKRENPSLQKYTEIANKALDKFFDGKRGVSRVSPFNISE